MSDLEQRLRADAARPHPGPAPSLDVALGRISARPPARLAALAVAAAVVLIAGVVAVLAGVTHHRSVPAGGGSSVAPAVGYLPPNVAIRGVWIDPAHPTRLNVSIGYVAGARSCPQLVNGRSHVLSQNATSVHLKVDAYLDGAGLPPTGGATPSGGASSSSAGSAGPDACTGSTDVNVDVLRAVPGDRAVYVNDQRVYPAQINYPRRLDYRPAGYAALGGLSVDPANPDVTVVKTVRGPGGATLTVAYGQPAALVATGTVIGAADVNGRPATLTAATGHRTITWSLPGRCVLQVTSRGAPPLSATELIKVARGLH
jgi:hypothetical protein